MSPAAPSPRDQGLSLIELVVAMALFALVAVIGAQALSGMMRMRASLEQRSQSTAALATATRLLRADLEDLAPLLFYPPDRAPPRSALRFSGTEGQRRLALSLAGQLDLTAAPLLPAARPGQIQRVIWQLRDGQLSRQSWPVLMPASATDISPAMPVLSDVDDLRLRLYWPGEGWRAGTDPATAIAPGSSTGGAADGDGAATAQEQYSDSLPIAVELRLYTKDFGEIILIETLK